MSTISSLVTVNKSKPKRIFVKRLVNDFKVNKSLYLMILPVLAFYIIFNYFPMYGAIIAFKDYSPMKGILGSEWIGLRNFSDFILSPYFFRILSNTVSISTYLLIFEFPSAIILALLINEIRNKVFGKIVQAVTYLPYFISLVVICGIIREFTSSNGLISTLIYGAGENNLSMLQDPKLFKPIFVISEIWQRMGWNSIIYIAALSSIETEQYEAARIDGANRFQQLLHITLPGLLPIITIMFILRIGNLMNVGFEKIILLYNPMTYESADIISSYVFRKGLQDFAWSFSAAVGLFNSVINFALLLIANKVTKKLNQSNLW